MIDIETVGKLKKLPLDKQRDVLEGLVKMLAARPQHGGTEAVQDFDGAEVRAVGEE